MSEWSRFDASDGINSDWICTTCRFMVRALTMPAECPRCRERRISNPEPEQPKTNAEKFREVFGFEPYRDKCLADSCLKCPLKKDGFDRTCHIGKMRDWWDELYKGAEDK